MWLPTLAVILVLGSLLVISGMTGQYFHPITVNVPAAMAAALLVAYAVVPWAAYRWLKASEGRDLEDHDTATGCTASTARWSTAR